MLARANLHIRYISCGKKLLSSAKFCSQTTNNASLVIEGFTPYNLNKVLEEKISKKK